MLERTLEIALSRYPQLLNPDWILVGQQLGTGAGILDLLFKDILGNLHLVEVKKGPATAEAVSQVLRYVERYKQEGRKAVPWVVAHSVPPEVQQRAESLGVRTRGISMAEVEQFLVGHGSSVNELMSLRRRTPGALTGGAGDLWKVVRSDEAYAEMSSGIADLLRELSDTPEYTLKTGAMQTTIWYRGVKAGGYNRKHRGGVGYITSGVISPPIRLKLEALGFTWKEKQGARKRHVHTWMEIPGDRAINFHRGLELVCSMVKEKLGK